MSGILKWETADKNSCSLGAAWTRSRCTTRCKPAYSRIRNLRRGPQRGETFPIRFLLGTYVERRTPVRRPERTATRGTVCEHDLYFPSVRARPGTAIPVG